jgi:hypothetical protein
VIASDAVDGVAPLVKRRRRRRAVINHDRESRATPRAWL